MSRPAVLLDGPEIQGRKCDCGFCATLTCSGRLVLCRPQKQARPVTRCSFSSEHPLGPVAQSRTGQESVHFPRFGALVASGVTQMHSGPKALLLAGLCWLRRAKKVELRIPAAQRLCFESEVRL